MSENAIYILSDGSSVSCLRALVVAIEDGLPNKRAIILINEEHRHIELLSCAIRCTDEELVHIGLSVADGSMDYPELLEWVIAHKE